MKKAGFFGEGSDPSLANMETTTAVVGLSSARCCTHNKPMCIDRNTSLIDHDSPNDLSIRSRELPSS
ncbi:hypothetical protein HanIR_Chr08g0357081 [Helianthus annuus]|nr:hypothetical protein HanIR_Chr08g0357081 [Helianthus annuus]